MDEKDYFWKTKKRPPKTKARAKPLPKAKEKYLEAEETLFQELEEHLIGYERKFQPIHTKHWRFDFHIVRLRLLVEIVGGPWSGGRNGKLRNKAYSYDRYDRVEDMGYKIERIGPDTILSGYMIHWIKAQLERLENGTDQTIPTDRPN
jgi:very-short-patch-repair endonuclease